MTQLSRSEAVGLRLRSLLLAGEVPPGAAAADVAGVVRWFGAMQAQDLASGLWSFGCRVPGSTKAAVEEAIERREALRTWPMRGTVHFVPSQDAPWRLEGLGARPLAAAARRRRTIGLEETEADRAVAVLAERLSGGGRLSRQQCLTTLQEAGIDSAGQLGYHLLWYASQCGVTCIAPNVDGEQTFVLLDEWVPDPVQLDRDEALATIALRYFRSHGPATRQDFTGWTGLTVADVRTGIEGCGDALTTVLVNDVEHLVASDALDTPAGLKSAQVLALPGFDEFVLGYKDRGLVMDPEQLEAVLPGGNGIFRSTIVRRGRVVATWKRSLVGSDRVRVEVWPTNPMAAPLRRQVERAMQPFAAFHARRAEVLWP
jgi:hypothetical protein